MNPEKHPSDHEELRDLCAAYALGALDPPESAQLEEHLREGCEICDSEIAEHRRTVAALGSLLEERTPPKGAEEHLVARLASEAGEDDASAPVRPAGRTGGWPRWVPKAAAVLLAALALWITQDLDGWLRWMPAAVAVLLAALALWISVDSSREVARLEHELAAFETTTDPIVPIYDLEATQAAAGARARASFDPRTQLWRLFAHDLVPPPAGLVYEAWVITGDGPHDLGTFLPDETGHAFLALRLPGDPAEARVRVTLEPAGGSERPTGEPVFRHPGAEIPPE